ncbi:MAG: glycosyltransferase family 2 protein [Opitutaceae bacterium]|nr:glycosyltransferase family 2 protein [Opitutaceae bacterium]
MTNGLARDAQTVRISFIIPLFNCLPLTQAMLASLRATLPAGLTHEIIFVDDGSTDGTRAWLATLAHDPAIRVVLNDRNLGYAAANNRGAAEARGEILALLNNDLILLPRWLERMLAAHRTLGERAGLIGNIQLDAKTGAVDHTGLVVNICGKPVHARARPGFVSRLLRPVRRAPAVTGACVLVSRALWWHLGGFDEGYLNSGEDIDLCFRAAAAGRINAVAVRSVVRHHVSASPGRKARDEHNSFRLARRWRRELVAAADDGFRTWCRDYLASLLPEPPAADWRRAVWALAFLTRVRVVPPPDAIAAVEAGLAREFAHWERTLGPASRAGL